MRKPRADGYCSGKVRIHREILQALEYQCNRCPTRGKWPKVVLHHKNRNRADNRPENLEALCTACHAKEHHADGLEARRRGIARVLADPEITAKRMAKLRSAEHREAMRQKIYEACDTCTCSRRKLRERTQCANCRRNAKRRVQRRLARLTNSRQTVLWREG
jgi:5-methylcytosine-specific restriction endonuclease McrA